MRPHRTVQHEIEWFQTVQREINQLQTVHYKPEFDMSLLNSPQQEHTEPVQCETI